MRSEATEAPGSQPAGRPPLATFGNAGAGFKEGLPIQPWAAELQKKRAEARWADNPDAMCFPQGPLQYHLDPQPRKIVQTPGQILIIYESNYGLRTIYTDGRNLPLRVSRSRIGTVTPSDDGRATRSWSSRIISTTMDGSIPGAARIPTLRG